MPCIDIETESFWETAQGARWALRWGDAQDRVLALHALGEFAIATGRARLKARAIAMLGDIAAHDQSKAIRFAAAETIHGVSTA